jgi:DNA-binding transcriptional LysR family regulator
MHRLNEVIGRWSKPSWQPRRAQAGRQPRRPGRLTARACISVRLPTDGRLFARKPEKGRREQRVRLEGQLVFNSIFPTPEPALAGFGLAYLPEEQVQAHLASGWLVGVVAD